MTPRYSLIFWIQPHNMSKNEIIEVVTKIISEINYIFYDGTLQLFETAKRKSDCKEVHVNSEYLNELFNKKRNREDHNLGLPYIFDFFSCFDANQTIKFSFKLGGVSHKPSIDCVVVDLPRDLFGIINDFQQICDVFKTIISISSPYFAFMANSLNENLSKWYWEEKPTFVHTLNYFDEDTAQKIGIEKLRKLQSAEETDGGWFLKLLDEPLDVDNPLHLEKQKQISEFLGLID